MGRPSLGSLSVLLVEHDPTYVRHLRATLAEARGQSFSIEHVGGLQAALDLLASGSFDVVLLDLGLPEGGGLEGLRRLVAAFPDLPVVVLVAWDREPLGLDALHQGAQDYLVREEEERRLPKALRFSVERRRAQDAVRRLEKAVDTMQLGVSITDTRGRIVFVNPAEAEMHGYTVGEMVGLDARSLSPRTDWRPLPPAEIARIRRWKRERVRLRKDGTVFPVQLMSDALVDEAGRPLGVVTTCEDIGERRRAEEARRVSEERYALALRGANDGIWDWSLEEDRLYVSPRWKGMLGYGEDELGDSPEEWFSRIHAEDAPRVREKVAEHLQGRSTRFEDEYRVRHRDGRYLWVLARGHAVRDAQGRATRMAGAQTDVTDRRAHDPLTGLPNRALMAERLEEALARCRRRLSHGFAVLFLDLDRFKAVNDRLGHAAGDAALLEVAHRLERTLRPGDVVGRVGGDEFAVLLDRLGDAEEALRVAARVREELGQPLWWEGYPLSLSASMGLALSASGYDSAEQLLREADAAMYDAKAAGRGCEIFDAAMRERIHCRQRLDEDLRHALARGELRLRLEPLVSLATGQPAAFEARLHWEHPQGALLGPARLRELAERAGVLSALEQWALDEACRRARRRGGRGLPQAVALGLSAARLRRADLPELLVAALATHGVPPSALWLEVAEACLVDDPGARDGLARLRAAGLRTVLAGFGSGVSPLAPLLAPSFDAVKVDATVVAALRPGEDPPLLRALATLAPQFGWEMMAQGVSTMEQRDRLTELGFTLAQGPLFAGRRERLAARRERVAGPEAARSHR